MKTLTFIPKTTFLAITYMACISCTSVAERSIEQKQQTPSLAVQHPAVASPVAGALPPAAKKKIKIALLLDTSNSMDGLINQAKSQL